jgi:ribonucleoside-diphosphate reductase alpha chain
MGEDLFIKEQEKKEQLTEEQAGSIYDGLAKKRERPSGTAFQEITPSGGDSVKDSIQLNHELKIYSFDEAMKSSVEYFKGDSLAASVWVNKYALKDSEGNIYELNPEQMHRRIAKEIHRIELKYNNPLNEEDIFDLLKDFKYLVPQGGPMSGIGNEFQVASLSNCFVIGYENADSYGGIMKVDEEQVQLMKRRGGVGHDLSNIRPKSSKVLNSAITSTGIVPFMERYSNSTREVAQDGRRGALMLSISIKHPDAEDFIDAKMTPGKVTGANVSVKIDDEFMKCVRENSHYTQQFPIESPKPSITNEIDAVKLWNKIIHNAWASAEPGILFWDTIIRESVPDCYADLGFRTVSTNPCGEIPLCPYDSCRLIAINLYSYVNNPFTKDASFDSELFVKHAHAAQRIMDDIIDLELEKIEKILSKIINDPENEEIKSTELQLWKKIRQKALEGRRTGIGITAEGDMLAALGIKYGSEEAVNFSEEVHKTLAIEVYRSSVYLAKERGAFNIYDYNREKHNPFIQRLFSEDKELEADMKQYGRRNISLLTVAPTGSVSICTQTTSGIEPVFMVSYTRRKKVNPNDQNVKISFTDEQGDSWEEYKVFHHKFVTWAEAQGYSREELDSMEDSKLDKLIASSPYHGATSNDVDWVMKVQMQGRIQKWVDHSISVTVNLPAHVDENLVAKVYQTAWESGCKGITVYREGSRSGVLVASDSKKEKQCNAIQETHAPGRPSLLQAHVVRFRNNEEEWIAFVGLLEGRPYEIFTGKDDDLFLHKGVKSGWISRHKTAPGEKARYDFEFQDKHGYRHTIQGLSRMFDQNYWNYAKLISGVLRHGMPLPYVVELVANLQFDEEKINTWKNGVARAMKKFIPNGTTITGKKCPNCGDEKGLEYRDGCQICKSCGSSKCD